jgi:tetratricopeptide (TPR) repeat protein/tRNA A-37 threonylcarbamoyl transferase component Bud32
MSVVHSRLAIALQEAIGNNYRLIRELGGGGMSQVFLAEDVALGRKVVIKVLPPDMAAAVSAERFRREIRMAAGLQHPNIVPVLTADASNDLLWYAMPFVEGDTLRARLARDGALPVADAVRIWRDLLEALEAAHAQSVVHRDVKPENILLNGRRALVMDFGVAKAVTASTREPAGSATMTSVGLAIGTPAYMAPEQAAGDPNVDARADVYAAALVMYEMLAGQGPFDAPTAAGLMAAHIATEPSLISEKRRDVSAALSALVMGCLAKRPDDRPMSAGAVLQQLDAALNTRESGGVLDTAVARSGSRRPLMIAAALVVVGLVSVAAWQQAKSASSDAAEVNAGSVIPDSARLQVAMLPMSRDAADTVLAKSLSESLFAALNEEPRVLVLREPQIELLVDEAGLADSTVTNGVRVNILRDYGVQSYLVRSMARVGTGVLLTIEGRSTETDSILFRYEKAASSAVELTQASQQLASQARAALARAFGRVNRPQASGKALGTTADAARLYVEGLDHFYRQDYTSALTSYRAAVASDSAFAQAWSALGATLGNLGASQQDAVRARSMAYRYRASIASPPLRAYIDAQYHVRVTREADLAIRELQQALKDDVSPRIRYRLFNLLYLAHRLKGNDESALRVIRETMKQSGTTPTPPTVGNLISQLLRMGRLDEARGVVVQLESMVGRSSPAYIHGRQVLVSGVHDTDSMIALGSAPGNTSLSSTDRIFQLRMLRSGFGTSGRVDSALAAERRLRTELRSTGNRYELLKSMASEASWRLQLLDDRAGARRVMDDALLELKPDTMGVLDRSYLARIDFEVAMGDTLRAQRLLDEWTSSMPSNLLPVAVREIETAHGVLALARGRGDEAIARFREGSETYRRSLRTSHRLSRAFDVSGQRDSAIAYYEIFVSSNDEFLRDINIVELAHSYRRLGELHEERGDIAKAIRRYGEFVELWKGADPALQPAVQAARARIAKLQAKRG